MQLYSVPCELLHSLATKHSLAMAISLFVQPQLVIKQNAQAVILRERGWGAVCGYCVRLTLKACPFVRPRASLVS